jgi:hypothetical protein
MKTFLSKAKEAQDVMPAMGVKVEIEEIERSETSDRSQTPGCLQYEARLRVVEPPEYAGMQLRDWFMVGTREDKRARKPETWERAMGGVGRLMRMMKRSGVPITDDDEEWMEAAVGQVVCVHIGKRADENGVERNRIQHYFRESDPDFVGVGEKLEAASGGRRGPRPDVSEGARTARRTRAQEDEEEEKPAKKTPPKPKEDEQEGDEEDEEPQARRSARAKQVAREPNEDEDEDED